MAVSMKYLSLSVMVIQTTSMIMLLRYSRSQKTDGPRYLSSTAVLLAEIIKLITSMFAVFVEKRYVLSHSLMEIQNEVIFKPWETLKLLIPSVMYTIQNNLLFLALSYLDAATYQVTYQLKILTTALFSVLILNKHLTVTKWSALVVLMAGVALVQMPSNSVSFSSNSQRNVTSQFIGLTAVLCACFSSGFAGVYFEKILKGSYQTIWIRNIQMAVICIISGFLGTFVSDYKAISEHGFFQGYNSLTWIVILLQAYGGLIVGFVVKYADNILKGFAASLSIIFSTLLSACVLHDFNPSFYFLAGTTTVIAATIIYGFDRSDVKAESKKSK